MSTHSSVCFADEVQRASTAAEVVTAVRAAVTSPEVYFYGALLEALQQHASQQAAVKPDTDLANWTSLVELLAFKSIADVDAAPAGLKALMSQHPVVMDKLRILSFLTLCSQHSMSTSGVVLTYAEVEKAVGVKGPIAVQTVVLAAVQQKLCVARLNERTATMRVLSYESRDVTIKEVVALQEKLAQWTTYATGQLRDIE